VTLRRVRPLVRDLTHGSLVSSGRRGIWTPFTMLPGATQWLDPIWNRYDAERAKAVGPDRLCAEWLLRCGGRLRWEGCEAWLSDYNALPPETSRRRVSAVDASGACVTSGGLRHLVGTGVTCVTLHDNPLLCDAGMAHLCRLADSLRVLQVSANRSVSDVGLRRLAALRGLHRLTAFELAAVETPEATAAFLRQRLPQCEVEVR